MYWLKKNDTNHHAYILVLYTVSLAFTMVCHWLDFSSRMKDKLQDKGTHLPFCNQKK